MAEESDGWIKFYWKTKNSLAWSTGASAALWSHILLSTAHKRRVLKTGETIKAGDCIISQSKLSEWLGVNRKVVARLLKAFEADGMITVGKTGKNGTYLSVCGWRTYQKSGTRTGQQRRKNGTRTGQERDNKGATKAQQERNNGTQTKSIESRDKSPKRRESSASRKPARPPGGLEEVKAYWQQSKLKGSPSRFFDYNQAKGWAGIKDWTSSAKVWSDREGDFRSGDLSGRTDMDLTIPAETRR